MVPSATFALQFTLLLFVIALVPLTAAAAEFRIRQGPYSGHLDVKVIELTGEITSGDSDRLKALFDANFKCVDAGDCSPHSAMASLNSPGGDYQEGQNLARFFRENSVATIVESGNACLSACAIAFLGGTGFWSTGGIGNFVARYIEPGARIGFHAPYLRPDEAQEIAKSDLPLVLTRARLDNQKLAEIINRYFVDPYVIGNILVKGPEETYDIDTIDDMLKFRVNFPFFPPSFVSGTLAEKVRNVCLKLLSVRNAQPISEFEDDYLDKQLGANVDATRSGEKVFGYVVEDRPLNIDFCGFTGTDASHPRKEGDVQLFRLGHSDDGAQSYADSFYGFTNAADGWSTAGYEQQLGSRSIIAIDAPLNYWMYDSKARIADVAKDFGDYLKLQKTPPAVSVKDVQAGYLERPGVKPGWETARARGYFLDGLQAEASVFPRDMFGYLERDAFAPRAGFTITYSQKFPDAFVVTGKDGEGTADLYVLGLRNDKGSAVVRMRAPWAEGTRAASDGARNAISAVACSTRFGATRLPCYR